MVFQRGLLKIYFIQSDFLSEAVNYDYTKHPYSIVAVAPTVSCSMALVLGLIRRTFGSKDPVAVKTAYNVLVRPILEYACPVWNPHLVKHIHSIESIQRRATRLICGSVKSYSERLAEHNWSTLELRRKYLCFVQLYKIIHGYSDVDYTRYIELSGPTRTRRNQT